MDSTRRIAVIGAGASGLTAIKCLKEVGLVPVCFEKTKYIGGLWKYHEEDVQGIPSVPWYTFMDHSKEMWAFSDFPPKKELPNFMRHTEVYDYLADYVQEFNLLEHIIFRKEVVKVKKSQDFEASGRWLVSVMDTETRELAEECFDGVLICSGHLWDPYIPSFPELDKFGGKVIHTHGLKKVDEFGDQRVVVIGTGNAGLDAAVEISNVAKQVYLSSRSSVWTIPRLGLEGLPNDIRISQWNNSSCKLIYQEGERKFLGKNHLNQMLDHDLYNLKPKKDYSKGKQVINDSIALKICSGTVIVKKRIKIFTENGVYFEENPNDHVEADVVVLATGYNWKFPFLERGILDFNGKRIDLYKCVYPPQLKHGTLAFIGFIKPIGPAFPVFEMQCRWASHILTEKVNLPTRRSMLLDIALQYENNCSNFPQDRCVFLKADYVRYMQDISSKISARPYPFKMCLLDPKLFRACYFGPAVSYLYRLQGPNAWAKARDVILHTYDRMIFPIHGRKRASKVVIKSKWSKLKIFLLLNVALIAIAAAIFLRMLKHDAKLRNYLIFKLFPYVNMVQQAIYGFQNNKLTCGK